MTLVIIVEAEQRVRAGLMLDPDILEQLARIETDLSVDSSWRLRAASVATKGVS
jgi:hypothetical protein